MDCQEVEAACESVQSVASESNRYTGKKERSQQRASFRDISQAVEVSKVTMGVVKWVWLISVVMFLNVISDLD